MQRTLLSVQGRPTGTDTSEAAVFNHLIRPFDSCTVVVRLTQDELLHLNILSVFLDAVLDSALYARQVTSVLRVVRGDWHHPLLAGGVLPIEDVVGIVSKHPDRCFEQVVFYIITVEE